MLNLTLPPYNKPSWLSQAVNESPLKQCADVVKPLSHKRIRSVTPVTAQFNSFRIYLMLKQDFELEIHKKSRLLNECKGQVFVVDVFKLQRKLITKTETNNKTWLLLLSFFGSTKNSLPNLTTWFLICKESLDKKLHWQQQDFFLF